MNTADNATRQPNYPYQIKADKTMTQPTPALRCHDAEACALGQRPCPSPAACCCAPTEANSSIAESEKENAARHYGAMALEARAAAECRQPNAAPATDRDTHFYLAGWNGARRGDDSHTNFRSALRYAPASPPEQAARALPAGMVPAAQPGSTLAQIGAVAACFGDDWPDVPGEPEVLRRVKWAARQLKAQESAPLTDERIREIDDETHFHESPDWPRRFARSIEAEVRKKPAP